MIYLSEYVSPLGGILLAADEIGMRGLWFDGQKYFARGLPGERRTGACPAGAFPAAGALPASGARSDTVVFSASGALSVHSPQAAQSEPITRFRILSLPMGIFHYLLG